LESYPCETKDQPHARERFYVKNNECINMITYVGLINEIGYAEYKKSSNEKIKMKEKHIEKKIKIKLQKIEL